MGTCSSKKKPPIVSIIVVVVLVVAAVVVLGAVMFVLRRRKQRATVSLENPHPPSSQQKKREASSDDGRSQASSSHNSRKGDTRLSFLRDDREPFDLQDLLRASAEILGSGCFSSSYKAALINGPMMVVKRFKQMNNVGKEEFQEHMRRIGRLNHPNLLPLVAYYYRKEEKLLISDFVHNGSLAVRLHGMYTLINYTIYIQCYIHTYIHDYILMHACIHINCLYMHVIKHKQVLNYIFGIYGYLMLFLILQDTKLWGNQALSGQSG